MDESTLKTTAIEFARGLYGADPERFKEELRLIDRGVSELLTNQAVIERARNGRPGQ